MQSVAEKRNLRQVGIWLLIGVAMIMIQVLLGGITRLTESGLSITEWKPITGALPPMNDAQWMAEFNKYKYTDQFRHIHADFTLADFKSIFFWEWFHRVWARLMGVVFLIGFVYFLVKKKFNKEMVIPMIILFLLGALQGAIGWFMVKSGLLPEKLFVGHIELTTHFIAALMLQVYTFWFALGLLIDRKNITSSRGLHNIISIIIAVLFIQLIYGGFMAGLKAATAAPTWPDINGALLPHGIKILSPWWHNLTDNKITVQLIHRSIAYLLLVLVTIFYIKSKDINNSSLFSNIKWLPLTLVILQIALGILTVVNSTNTKALIGLGIAHQFTGMLLVLSMVLMLFLIRRGRVNN